ncbi:MAG: acetyl-CoA carboxylase biotin carboxyl carrier protein [Candidatus Acidiferrales bacterium]
MPKKPKPPKPSRKPHGVDLSEIETLLDFMEAHGLEEFEFERDAFRIRLKKPSAAPPPGSYRAFAPPDIVVASSPAASASSSAPAPAREPASEPGRSDDLHVVKSPIVGTFYASASPNSPAFVTVGASVESGQVLCIIEAMKLMNEIEADVSGEVVRIFVENGHPVEYGEPLFGIHPHRKK